MPHVILHPGFGKGRIEPITKPAQLLAVGVDEHPRKFPIPFFQGLQRGQGDRVQGDMAGLAVLRATQNQDAAVPINLDPAQREWPAKFPEASFLAAFPFSARPAAFAPDRAGPPSRVAPPVCIEILNSPDPVAGYRKTASEPARGDV